MNVTQHQTSPSDAKTDAIARECSTLKHVLPPQLWLSHVAESKRGSKALHTFACVPIVLDYLVRELTFHEKRIFQQEYRSSVRGFARSNGRRKYPKLDYCQHLSALEEYLAVNPTHERFITFFDGVTRNFWEMDFYCPVSCPRADQRLRLRKLADVNMEIRVLLSSEKVTHK